MNEGTHAVLIVDGQEYELSYFKITDDAENYFCSNIEMVICDDLKPELTQGDSYIAKLVVNGDALWYLPWVWFKNTELPNLQAATHGAIFCPFGLEEEDENRYDAINLIIASDVCYNMTAEVWQNLLLIFSDWLQSQSIPQYKDYIALAKEIDISDDDDFDDDDDEDEDDDFDDDEEEESFDEDEEFDDDDDDDEESSYGSEESEDDEDEED